MKEKEKNMRERKEKMTLYEIENEIMSCFDEETGEIFDSEKLEKMELERNEKIENICLFIKNLRAEAEALKKEKDAFAKRQKTVENKMESLKRFMEGYLAGEKFKTPKVSVSWRKSDKVEVDDVYKLPEEFVKYKEPEVKKEDLKKAIKEGKTFEGVHLIECNNIQIR